MKKDFTKIIPLRENPEQACAVLCTYLEQCDDKNRQQLIFEDLLSKISELRPEAMNYYLAKGQSPLLPPPFKKAVLQIKSSAPPRKHFDVLIVTIIEDEREAALTCFGIDPKSRETINLNGIRVWETDLVINANQPALKVGLCMVGEARTLPCALACTRMFTHFDISTAILTGIAAGLKEKVKTGEVIVSDTIIDYEGQRLASDGPKIRPVSYDPPITIKRDMGYFSPNIEEWKKFVVDIGSRLLTNDKEKEAINEWEPAFDTGVILAGEKLIEGIKLPEMREQYHDKVRAVEMEGSGFARACSEFGVDWLVFRGISDYGDEDGVATRKKWKRLAALAASSMARQFLITDYRKAEDKTF